MMRNEYLEPIRKVIFFSHPFRCQVLEKNIYRINSQL